MKLRFKRAPATTPTSSGQKGEDIATEYLQANGFKVLHRNVKTTRYEIDIIAKRKKQLYFVEVKYRSSSQQGKGYEYVTERKLQQMSYAAKKWVSSEDYKGPYQLAVVSVDEDEVQFIDEIWQ